MAHLSLKELQSIFGNYLRQILDDEAGNLVRRSYPTEGQPFQELPETVCYYTVLPADYGINRQIDTQYEDLDGNQARVVHSYTRVLSLQLTFYGPEAYEKAFLARLELLSGSRDNLLARNGLHLVPDIAEPVLTWELYQNHWLERADVVAQFHNRVNDEGRHTVGYIQSAPIGVIGGAEERMIEIKEGE